MEKLRSLLPSLVGKVFSADDVAYRIESHSDRRVKCVTVGNEANVRQFPLAAFFKAYLSHPAGSKSTGSLPVFKKEAILSVWKNSSEMDRLGKEKQRAFTKAKRKVRELKSKLKKLSTQEKVKKSGRLLHKDETARNSLDKRLAKAIAARGAAEEAVRSHAKQKEETFGTEEELLLFFEQNFNIKVSRSTLFGWKKNGVGGKVGRPTKIDVAMEANILKVALEMDRIGFPMTRFRIMGIATELLRQSAKDKQQGEEDVDVSVSWFAGFMRRAKEVEPQLCATLVRNQKNSTLTWFNSANVEWWFEKFTELILREGFARKTADGKLEWLTPERVIIFDETAVSGALTQKAAVVKKKGLTIDARLEKGEKSGKYRRATIDIGSTEEHITAIMGHTLSFQPIVPIWIVSSEKKPKETVLKKIIAAAPKGSDLSVRDTNGNEINETIVGWSKKGGVTQGNIDELLLKLVDAMFKDMADTNGKRVLIGTDWHNSRFNLSLLEALRERGCRLIGWLPNTTSKMQSPDVELFGPFKTRRSKLEAQWVRENEKKVDRYAKIKIAGDAMVETFTYARIKRGAEKVGLRPINKEILLQDQAASDGDVLAHNRNVNSALDLLARIQDFGDAPNESFQDSAMAFLLQMKSKKPRLGPCRKIWSPNEEIDEEYVKTRLVQGIESLKQMQQDVVSDKAKHLPLVQEEAEAQKNKLKSSLKEAEELVESLKSRLEVCDKAADVLIHHCDQQAAHYSEWQNALRQTLADLDSPAKRQLAAVILQYIADISAIPQSSLRWGLVKDERSGEDFTRQLEQVKGYDNAPLLRLLEEGNKTLQMRSKVSQAGNRRSNARMTGGSVMFHSDSIEMTSEEIMTRVEEQEQKNQEKQQQKEKAQADRRRREEDHLFKLQGTMKTETTKVVSYSDAPPEVLKQFMVPAARDYVKLAETYLKFRVEREDSEPLKQLLTEVQTAKKKQRNEMKIAAIQLALKIDPFL